MTVVLKLTALVMDRAKLQTVVYDILPSGGRCRKAVFGVWDRAILGRKQTPELTAIRRWKGLNGETDGTFPAEIQEVDAGGWRKEVEDDVPS